MKADKSYLNTLLYEEKTTISIFRLRQEIQSEANESLDNG